MGLPEGLKVFESTGLDLVTRRYYTTADGMFVKMNTDEARITREIATAKMIESVATQYPPPFYFPHFVKDEIIDGKHYVWSTLIDGVTLEHLAPTSRDALCVIIGHVMAIPAWFLQHGLVHGDFNESNIFWSEDRKQCGVIDWEFSGVKSSLEDIYGTTDVPWGLLHVIRFLREKKCA